MVSVTLELSEERAATLRARAEAEGVSTLEPAAAEYDFTPEQGDEITP